MVLSCWNPPTNRSSGRGDRICSSTYHCCLSRTPLLTNTGGNSRRYARETVKHQSASSQKANVTGTLLPKAPDVTVSTIRAQEEDLIQIYVMQRECREMATTRHSSQNDRGCYIASSGAPTALWSAKTTMNDTQSV